MILCIKIEKRRLEEDTRVARWELLTFFLVEETKLSYNSFVERLRIPNLVDEWSLVSFCNQKNVNRAHLLVIIQ